MNKYRGVMFLIAFVDILLAFVTVYMALNAVELVAMHPTTAAKGNIQSDAQVMIELSWKDNCDFDLWTKDPKGNIVYYLSTDLGQGHLERDSMGSMNNYIQEGIQTKLYKENWFMRGIIPGTYRANIHLYSCKPKNNDHARTVPHTPVDNIPVTMSVIQLNPHYNLIYEKEVTFTNTWDERAVVKFDIDQNGSVSNVGENDELWVSDHIKESQLQEH